jgi:protein-ribulosamine 3-kinase
MPGKHIENFLTQFLAREQGIPINSLQFQPIGGGSINNTYRLTINDSKQFFLKLNSASRFPGLFEKEKDGLQFLATAGPITVPSVICAATCEDDQLLLLQWIGSGIRTKQFWKKFGEQLAQLHRCSYEQFGFAADNYMGALPQLNLFNDSWTSFFISCRLLPQIELAAKAQLLSTSHISSFERLFKKLDGIFNTEAPSLLHGDLWSGNFMCNERAEPVLIDPAVYYGHRSMDLAMTTLFGGFDQAFYQAYHYHFPFPANHAGQWDICNLYPLLIHLNLFGQSYLGSIAETLRRFS